MFPRIALVALVLMLSVPHGVAFHGAPLVLQGSDSGQGWVMITLDAVGNRPLEFDVFVNDANDKRVGIGLAIVRNGVMTHLLTSDISREHPRVLVQSHVVEGAPIHEEIVLGQNDDFTLHNGVYQFWAQAGSYTLLGWASGDAGDWSWEIHGDGLTIREVTTGDRTFLATQRDFEGPVGVDAAPPRVGARAFWGDHTVQVENGLVGTFQRPGTDVMYADTPTGRKTCSCEFKGTPPGTYKLHVHGAGTTHTGGYSPSFNAADVALPN